MYLPMIEGNENPQRMEKILSLTRFNENTKKALVAIYVNGWTVQLAAYTFDIIENNLIRSIKALDKVNQTIHEIKHIS